MPNNDLPYMEFSYSVDERGRAVESINGLPGVPRTDIGLKTRLHDRIYPNLGLLPPVVRWISDSGRSVLLERPPTITTVSFHADKPFNIADGNVKEHLFDLPLPWLLYGVELGLDYYPESIHIFTLRHPVRTLQDRLGVLPLPNHYNSGALCMPPRDLAENLTSVADGLAAAFRIAWHSGFNLDLDNIRHAYRHRKPLALFNPEAVKRTPSAIRIYRMWQKASLADVATWVFPPPQGFGAPVAGETKGESATTVGNLISRFQVREFERGMNNAGPNMVIAIRQAMHASPPA